MHETALPQPHAGEAPAPRPRSLRQRLRAVPRWVHITYILAVVGAAVAIRVFLLESSYVLEASMEPTLHEGDRLLVYKRPHADGPAHRGDIVELEAGGGEIYIKRVIAVGGDEVTVFGGRVWVNGEELVEEYAVPDADAMVAPFQVPASALFVMGDNRPRSEDSRDWGPIPAAMVRGRVILRYWPPAKFGPVE